MDRDDEERTQKMIEDQIVRATALKKVISVHLSLLLYTLDRLMMMVPMMKRLPILIYRGKMKAKKVCHFVAGHVLLISFFPHPPSLPLSLSLSLSLSQSLYHYLVLKQVPLLPLLLPLLLPHSLMILHHSQWILILMFKMTKQGLQR